MTSVGKIIPTYRRNLVMGKCFSAIWVVHMDERTNVGALDDKFSTRSRNSPLLWTPRRQTSLCTWRLTLSTFGLLFTCSSIMSIGNYVVVKLCMYRYTCMNDWPQKHKIVRTDTQLTSVVLSVLSMTPHLGLLCTPDVFQELSMIPPLQWSWSSPII